MVTAILLMLGTVAGTDAQDRWPISLEANIGPGGGRTSAPGWNPDGYLHRSTRGTGAEVLVALRAGSVARGGVVAGLSLGIIGTGGYEAICILREIGGCVPHFPEFTVLAATVGLETANGGFRVMAGPARVTGDVDRTLTDREGSSATGWQGRIDWALPIVSRFSLCASVRGVLVPDYSGDSFQLWALGGGLRIR
jgi:hypothetical protein